VKTRLLPSCSAEQAADIARILLEETVRKCIAAWPGEVILSVWPDKNDQFLQMMSERYSLDIVVQNEGDLGQKMLTSFEAIGYPAAIMGCDVPHLPGSILAKVHQALLKNKNVLAPSEDGGYYLIGLIKTSPEIFTGITWGSHRVFVETLNKADQSNLNFEVQLTLNDVDTWQDVLNVAPELPSLSEYIITQQLVPANPYRD
jgi:rSAM/selenodomain-associated transferase 1